jgi:hypothetical protein
MEGLAMKLDLTIEGYEERRVYVEQELSKMDDKSIQHNFERARVKSN